MWKNQIILILFILHIGSSIAKSFQPTSFDYDYRVEGRNAARRNRGKSATTTTPRPLIRQYWQSFVRNLPTLPPFSWNIRNPIGNLFSAGAQEIIETPVAMHYIMEQEPNTYPNRIRKTKKTSKRKSSKKVKNRKGIQKNYYNSYDNIYGNGYQQTQLQLQPLGMDQNRIMHFCDPSSGQYYALQQEAKPNYYNNQYRNQYNNNQYNSYKENGYHQEDDVGYGDDSSEQYNHNVYDSEQGYDSDNGYEPEQGSESDNGYDSEHNGYDNDKVSYNDGHLEYDDGVELADNWGYNDEEIFADRKLKDEETDNINAIARSFIKIQKHLLKPESEEDVKFLLSKVMMPIDKKDKNTLKTETTIEKNETTKNNEIGSVRSVLGTPKKAQIRRKQILNTRKKLYIYVMLWVPL